MDTRTKIKRDKIAMQRLEAATIAIAGEAGLPAADLAGLNEQVVVSMRRLHKLEALADILEKAAAKLE